MLPRRLAFAVPCAAFTLFVLWPSSAPATIEDQRARLPPAASACDDPVVGEWMAFFFVDHLGEWYRVTLHVSRGEGDALTGGIDSEGYGGDAAHPDPQPCRPGYKHFLVHEPAQGTFHDGTIDFRGTSWSQTSAACVGVAGWVTDDFTGKLDTERQEFVTTDSYDMNGRHWDDPSVFRRIACQPAADPVKVPPPPPDAPRRGMSCGCGPRGR
jgi:hypothetical protein